MLYQKDQRLVSDILSKLHYRFSKSKDRCCKKCQSFDSKSIYISKTICHLRKKAKSVLEPEIDIETNPCMICNKFKKKCKCKK